MSLLAAGTEVVRPASIARENHLHLVMHDIAVAQDGMTMPGEEHVRELLDFARQWDRARPMVVHCYAGISRSTASAYIIAAALSPERAKPNWPRRARSCHPGDAQSAAHCGRRHAPGRNGRMIGAIQSIGRGADAFEGTPFELKIMG